MSSHGHCDPLFHFVLLLFFFTSKASSIPTMCLIALLARYSSAPTIQSNSLDLQPHDEAV